MTKARRKSATKRGLLVLEVIRAGRNAVMPDSLRLPMTATAP